ncbi:SpoIIE family protein phosphatase [Flavobacteriales bacterium]|nr:SpoIIE family protein phosphatase [Flavobacteriales bacterium]
MKFLLYIILSLVTICLSAQKFNFSPFNAENGLSGSNVTCIMEDQFGRLWFGTESGGVTISDGVNKTYLNIENHLPTNGINDLFEDSKGNIWIATNEGAVKYDGLTYDLWNFEDGLSANIIKTIFEDSNGNIWFGTERGRVCMFDGSKMNNFNSGKFLDSKSVNFISEKAGGIMLGTNDGLFLYDGNVFREIEKYPGFGFGAVTCLFQDGKRTWIGTLTGLNYIEDGRVTDFSMLHPFPSNIIQSIGKDIKGRIWVGTQGSGIIRIDDNDEIYNITDDNGLPSNFILELTVDDEQNIWIGTLSGGAARYGGDAFTYYTDESCLKNNFVYTLLEDSGAVWIGTGDGITISENGGFSYLNREHGLADNQIYSLLKDKSGLIWVGTYRGVSIIENREVLQNVGAAEGIKSPVISLFEDDSSNIWMGTYGQGVFKFDGEQLINYGFQSGLTNDIIFDIDQSKNGDILLATYGGGLNIISNDDITAISTGDGLPSNNIKSIAKDAFGEIWLGTEKGLVHYQKDLKVYGLDDGLSTSSIEMILFQNDKMWLGSDHGLDRITLNPPQIQRASGELYSSIKRFNGDNGLTGIQIYRGAGLHASDNSVWFGTVKGAVQCNQMSIDEEKISPPKLYFTNIQVRYQSIDWKSRNVKTTPFWNFPESFELSYSENQLTFEFIGIEMDAPMEVVYSWMLEGYDNTYTPLTKDRKVTYQQLPAGQYTFKLLACSNDDNCSIEPLEFKFFIRSPIWKTWWFITIAILSVIFASYFFVKIREDRLKRENEKLEDIIKDRTKEVVEKNRMMKVVNDEIVQKNEIIEQKNEEFNSSVRYAETIQTAFLPDKKELFETFEDSFIFYQPRDVVSGDFYWFKRLEKTFLVAAVDCTGHGVPGALMSMIGMTMLNGIDTNEVQNTGEALNQIDAQVNLAFENSEVQSQDGMDLALLMINMEEKVIQFSGAQRPLFLIRNGELKEFKSTKTSIGGNYEGIKSFDYSNILFKEGDCVYIFSDGYQDQFGGEKDKKFKVRNMKDLLISISGLPMKDQEKIIKDAFLDWKGETEQTDDVLVIGIRL